MRSKSMTIFYEVGGNIYVNLTNRCPCACTFCLRQNRDHMEDSEPLWLEHEPSCDEIRSAAEKIDFGKYNEVVFCGFGEPTEALDRLLYTADFIKKKYEKKIRVNTNGLGNLINGRDIAPLFNGLIDSVSISLNTPDPEKYCDLVRPRFGLKSYQAMLDFAKETRKYVPAVIMTTVSTTITSEEESRCAEICGNLGVTYRIREWDG